MIRKLIQYVKNPQYLSLGFVFASMSILLSFWVTRLPFIKVRFDLTDSELGMALFFIPVGAVLTMLITNRLINYLGEGKTAFISMFLLAGNSVLPFLARDIIELYISLFLIGSSMGLVDVSINAATGYIESQDKKSIMSTSHGFFSLGGIIGAGLASLFIGLDINPMPQMLACFGVISIVTIVFAKKHLLPINSHQDLSKEPILAFPKGKLIGLAIISFSIMISEGAITDWSTVYLQDFLLSDPFLVGMGYAGFSLCMTYGRFNGDYFIDKFGERNVILYGAVISIIGLSLVLIKITSLAIIGFSLAGLGYSAMIPVVFSRAANNSGNSPTYGIASVATAGYAGFLIGPVIMGFLSESFGLNLAFAFLIALTLLALVTEKIAVK